MPALPAFRLPPPPVPTKMKNPLRRAAAFIGKTCAALSAAAALYFAAAWVLGNWRTRPPRPAEPRPVAVYLVSNGVHSDIVMPVSTPQWNWRKWANESHTRAAFQAAVGRMRGADDKRTGKKQTGKAAANKFSGCLNDFCVGRSEN